MFVRAKTIKGKKYGYLVENAWVKGKVKQQVKSYLGKIVFMPALDSIEPVTVTSTNRKRHIQELIIHDLLQRGFTRKEKNTLVYEDIEVKLFPFAIRQHNKPVVLELNQRYVYDGLLNDLCNFYEPESTGRPGEKLARAFKEAGIVIAKENFIDLYKSIYMN